MPLTEKGKEVLANMIKEYGTEKGHEVFYASINSGKLTGVHDGVSPDPKEEFYGGGTNFPFLDDQSIGNAVTRFCDATEALCSRFDDYVGSVGGVEGGRNVRVERKDARYSVAEEEKKWKIRGRYPDGKKLEFSVLAFDYSDAKKKAEARKGGAQITDIVLMG